MSKNPQKTATSSKVLTTSAIRTVFKTVIICAIVGAIVGLGIMLASNLGLTASAAPETVVARRASNVSESEHQPPATIDLSGVTFEFDPVVYDGTEKTATITGAETLPEGVTVSYRNNVHTNAGTYTAIAIFSGKGYKTAFLETEMVINKAPLTGITFENKAFNYTGSAFSIELAFENGKKPEGINVEYVGNGVKDLGTHEVVAIVYGDNYVTKDYSATITVNPSDITGITLVDGTFSYDELAHALNFAGTLPAGVEYVWADNSRTEVGTNEVTLTLSGYGYNELVLKANITVEKGDLLKVYGITFDNKTLAYDAAAHQLDLAGKLDGVTVTYTYNGVTTDTLPTFIAAGAYEVTVKLSKESFNDAEITSTLVINKANIESALDFGNTTHTYNGEAVGLTIGTHGNYFADETTLTYTYNGEEREEPFTFTEAGTYEVTITVKGDNVETYTATKTVTINKATIDFVHFSDVDYNYRADTERTIRVDIDGELPEGVYVEYSCNGTVAPDDYIYYVNAGEYEFTATVKGNPNYEEVVLTATLIIEKGDAGYYIDLDRRQDFSDDGNAHLPVVNFFGDAPAEILAADVKFYLNGELLTEGLSKPGDYEITVVVESENYYYEDEIDLSINYNATILLTGAGIGALVGILLGIIISITGSARDKSSQNYFTVPRDGISKARGGIICESRAKNKNSKRNGRLYLTSQTLEFYAEDYKNAANNHLINLSEIRNVEVLSNSKIVVCANRKYITFVVPAGSANEWKAQIEKA